MQAAAQAAQRLVQVQVDWGTAATVAQRNFAKSEDSISVVF
jgi:hypothetical protein